MSDMTADRDAVTAEELAAALEQAQVLMDEYTGYDEEAARRRIARRFTADRTHSATGAHGTIVLPAPTPAPGLAPLPAPVSRPADDLVLDAACHVRAARVLDDLAWFLAENSAFAELALAAGTWPHGAEPALLFGCLLHLSDRTEGAQFWFQYAAGAGSQTAARLLYLHHLARAEVRTARHWKVLAGVLPSDEGLPLLPEVPENLEEALGASVIWTSPPITTQDLTALTRVHGHGGRPPYRLPVQLERAVTARIWSEDHDLGEVYLLGPQVAVAVARHARLSPVHLAYGAGAWALVPLRQPHPARSARSSCAQRPAPVAMEAVHRALHVLEVVNRYSGGVSLAQIARETRLPQLALARVMEQLLRANLVAPAGPGTYITGLALLATGTASGDGRGHLQETLAWVRDAVGAAVYEEDLFRQLDTRRPGVPLLDVQEYAVGTVCAAVPITSGPNAECLALSIPASDPHRLGQAARILQSEAAAVLLCLIIPGAAPGAPRTPPQREEGAGGSGSVLITAT
ncbi:hypothetical protein ABZZ20_21595 [Streptomyces sp. NPDC006430]|uniref:hypothetical protein n=1 Tax=Streptomyces sp. NPDC006430 TaxID=3154299 RepID=UPI0033AE5442